MLSIAKSVGVQPAGPPADFLQYLQASSVAMRNSLKEPARSKALKSGAVHLRERLWVNGTGGEKVIVESLKTKPMKA